MSVMCMLRKGEKEDGGHMRKKPKLRTDTKELQGRQKVKDTPIILKKLIILKKREDKCVKVKHECAHNHLHVLK